jgi:hypothetical protein
MKNSVIFLTLLFAAIPGSMTLARSIVATITHIDGNTQVYSHPSKTSPLAKQDANGTTVLFEGQYYRVRDAIPGEKLENGNILRTRPGAHANVIFDNGDQIHLGPGSSYHIQWNGKNTKKIEFKLMYGKLRGIISKESDEKKIIIKTKIATMGVRGTDFFVSDSGPKGETEITVLRGMVEVTNESTGKLLPVKTGTTALVTEKSEISPRDSTKEDLKTVETSSKTEPTKETPKTVVELEKKALAVTLQDIKLYQPEIYEKIKADPGITNNVLSLNEKAVVLNAATAPSAPPKKGKPRIRELNDSDDQEIYEKYFKLNE